MIYFYYLQSVILNCNLGFLPSYGQLEVCQLKGAYGYYKAGSLYGDLEFSPEYHYPPWN